MRKVVPKDAVINGEGKGFPYTVVSDLAKLGVVCLTSDGESIILPPDTIQAHVTYSIKLPVTSTHNTPAQSTTPNKNK